MISIKFKVGWVGDWICVKVGGVGDWICDNGVSDACGECTMYSDGNQEERFGDVESEYAD